MDKSQIGIANSTKPLFTSSAFRHRHLKSYTYNTFVNMFSNFYQNPLNSQHSQQELIEKQACDRGGKSGSMPDAGVSERKGALDWIEEIMGVDEIEGLLEQNSVHGDGDGREEGLLEELAGIIKRNGERVDADSVDGVELHNQEPSLVGQVNVERFGEANDQLREKNDCSEKSSEAVELDPGNTAITRVVEGGENCGKNGPSPNVLQVGNKELQKVVEVDKSVRHAGMPSSLDNKSEEREIKKGELPGQLTVIDETVNNVPIALKEKKDGISVSNNRDINGYFFDEQDRAGKRDSVAALLETDVGARNGRMELGKRSSEEVVHQPESVAVYLKLLEEANLNISALEHGRKEEKVAEADDPSSRRGNLVFYGDIMEKNPTKIRQNDNRKEDAGVNNKKKRGGRTEERKANKKANKRKRRAEKNKQLGVKRLKLPPVMKSKTVSYCSHYLKGRCHEGEKCKFSHDTIPLTKSKPCCYFARHSCMKGDDCPFDHQLSKYPCNNFVSKGSCSRGDECMFSHKMPIADNSGTNSGVGDSEPKISSLLVNSNSKQPNVSHLSSQNGKALSHSKETHSCKKSEEKVADTSPKPSVLAFAGTGDNTLLVDSSKLKQCDSSKSKYDARIQNPICQRVTTGLNPVSTPNKLAMASRGINFLSFGKTLPVNTDKSPSSKNSNLQKQGSTPSSTDESNRVGTSSSQRLSNRIEDSNERLKISQPSASPSGINFLSFGKVSSDGASKQSSCTSGYRTAADRPSQEPSPSSRPSEFSSFPWRLSGSQLLSGQPSDGTTVHTKDTPNSAQKALFSTLAFAAKFEAQLKMKSSNYALGGESSKPHDHQVPQNYFT